MRVAGSPSTLTWLNALSISLVLLAAPVLSRILGPEGRGEIYPLLGMTAVLTSFLLLGSNVTIRALFVNGHVSMRKILTQQSVYSIFLVGSCLAFALIFLPGGRSLGLGSTLLVATLPLLALFQLNFVGVLLARQKYLQAGIGLLATPVSQFIAAITLLVWRMPAIPTMLLYQALGLITVNLFLAASVKSELRKNVMPIVDFAWLTSLSNMLYEVSVAIAGRLDLLLALLFLGTRDAGIYSLALTASMAIMVISGAVISVNYYPSAEKEGQLSLSERLSALIIITFFASTALGALSYALIPTIFGSEFIATTEIVVILCFASGFLLVTRTTSQILILSKRGRRSLINSLSALLAFILAFVLTQPLELLGLSLSVLIWHATSAIMNLRALGVGFSEFNPDLGHAYKLIRSVLRPG